VLGLDVRLSAAVVPGEVSERPAALLNDPDANRAVVLDLPPERVPSSISNSRRMWAGMFAWFHETALSESTRSLSILGGM